MKKKLTLAGRRDSHAYKQFLLAMRLTVFLFVFSVAVVMANTGHSQEAKITLQLKNATLSDVLNAIENNSSYYFMLNNKLIDLSKRIDIDVQDKMINEILTLLSEKTGIKYKIYARQIVLSPGDQRLSDFSVSQQQKNVSGKVTDSSGAPLPGVSVVVKGTTNGIITDANGIYSLLKVPDNATLVFSFVGMKGQEVKVAGKTSINITMVEESIGIEEVVAVGYGSQKKVNISGAVASVKVDQTISNRAITSLSSGLSGLLPGLVASQNSGMPGNDSATLRIRGLGTVNDSDPLIVIDGMPDGDINRLNVDDIESVSVLKDASSSAVYGSRAANGVILITTKRGKSGVTEIDYNGFYTITKPCNYPDYLDDMPLTMSILNKTASNQGKQTSFRDGSIDEWLAKGIVAPIYYPNTDWWSVIFRNGLLKTHKISATGGNDRFNFYLSVGYNDNKAVTICTKYKQYNTRINFDYNIRKNVKIGTTISGVWSNLNSPESGGLNTVGSSTSTDLSVTSPGITPIDPNTGLYGGTMAYGESSNTRNYYAILNNEFKQTTQQDFDGNIFGEWNVYDKLKFRVDYGLLYNNYFLKSWGNPLSSYNLRTGQIAQEYISSSEGVYDKFSQSYKTLFQMRVNYEKEVLKGQKLSVLGLYAEEYWSDRWLSGQRSNRFAVGLHELNATASDKPFTYGTSSAEGLKSYVGRLNYSVFDKYLFEANARYDGSSKFSHGHRWGFFPSLSSAWLFSNEKFFEPFLTVISRGKLRGSWGLLGNNSGVGRYEQQDTYHSTNYTFGGTLASGYSPSTLINEDLSWEKTRMSDIGIELGFLNNRLSTEVDFYERKTTDMIRPSSLSTILSSTYSAPNVNMGTLQNRGLEINLSWHSKIDNFSYDVGLNCSYSKTKLLKWSDLLEKGNVFLNYPYHFVYTYKAQGIAQSWQQMLNAPYQGNDNVAPGDILYEDLNGDGQITSEDRIAKPNFNTDFPSGYYGLNFNCFWKGFDLSILFQGATGRKSYWITMYNNLYPETNRAALMKDFVLNTWSIDNKNAEYPRMNGINNNRESTFWLQSMDYLRLKNVQAGFSLPNNICQYINIDKIRVYFSAENLFTITKWKGIDPEKTGGDSSYPYPLLKSFTFGINVTL